MANLWRALAAFTVGGVLLGTYPAARATDYSSVHFTVKDPVIVPGAGFSSSSGYELWSTIGQIAIGLSTGTSFDVQSGFLYFPSPAVTPPPPVTPPGAPIIIGAGTAQTKPPLPPEASFCDLNGDGAIDLIDLSILLFYYGKSGEDVADFDLSGNGLVGLSDISILFYHWTI